MSAKYVSRRSYIPFYNVLYQTSTTFDSVGDFRRGTLARWRYRCSQHARYEYRQWQGAIFDEPREANDEVEIYNITAQSKLDFISLAVVGLFNTWPECIPPVYALALRIYARVVLLNHFLLRKKSIGITLSSFLGSNLKTSTLYCYTSDMALLHLKVFTLSLMNNFDAPCLGVNRRKTKINGPELKYEVLSRCTRVATQVISSM